MMQSSTTAPHLDDGDLVRLHDQELDHDTTARFRRHVTDCAACAERLDVFAQQSAHVTWFLHRVAGDETPTNVSRPRRRYAGVVGSIGAIAVVGGALAADPVRTWIADTFAPEPAPPAASTPVPTPTPTPPPVAIPSVMRVSFAWEGGPVSLRFTARPAAGTLTITWESTRNVESVIENGGSEQIALVPGGVTITNEAESAADYFVVVPELVETVHVVVEGTAVSVPRPAGNRSRLELGALTRSSS